MSAARFGPSRQVVSGTVQSMLLTLTWNGLIDDGDDPSVGTDRDVLHAVMFEVLTAYL